LSFDSRAMSKPKFTRPPDNVYWAAPWSSILFAGDVFKAVPFTTPPTELYVHEEGFGGPQHFIGEVEFAYGLLISPTCDMYESVRPEALAHPFRVLVPILPIDEIVTHTTGVEQSLGLLRSRDSLNAYMYLPAIPGLFGESAACLFRPTVVAEDFLSSPPRRVAQMQAEARRHLKVKLAAYWARAKVEHEDLPLQERDEEKATADAFPPSRYDSKDALTDRPA
jgi:hypothetical protein